MQSAHPPRLGVVLAAGAGRRFGGPKILAAEGAWLRGAVAALRDGGCDAVAVCMGAAVIDPPPGVFGIVVADWADGLSASVQAALDEASLVGAAQVILHLIDLPDVTAPVISRVLAAAGDGQSALVRAAYDGRPGHPVVIGRTHWEPLGADLIGDVGGRGYLAGHPALRLVECGDLATGRDVDRVPQSEV